MAPTWAVPGLLCIQSFDYFVFNSTILLSSLSLQLRVCHLGQTKMEEAKLFRLSAFIQFNYVINLDWSGRLLTKMGVCSHPWKSEPKIKMILR